MTAFVLKIVLVALALVVAVVIVRSLFRGPGSGPAVPERTRLPRVVPIVAAALLALGLFASVLGFGSGDMRDPVPFRIASVVLVIAGLLVLLAHRNRYIQVGRDAVEFRTILGVERVIHYRDIVSHRTTVRRGRRMLLVTASSGVRLRVDALVPGMAPLVAAVAALDASRAVRP